MFARRLEMVVDRRLLEEEITLAVFRASGNGEPGPLGRELRVASIVDDCVDGQVVVELVHADLVERFDITTNP